MKKTIRHIAIDNNDKFVAFGEFKSMVYVYELLVMKQVSAFKTNLDFGGTRLSISNDNKNILAGAYNKYGISAYDINNGLLIWQNKTIKQLQIIKPSVKNSEHIYVSSEKDGTFLLKEKTGEIISKLLGVSKIWDDIDGHEVMFHINKGKIIVSLNSNILGEIRSGTNLVFDICFIGKRFLIAEGNQLHCYNKLNLDQVWSVELSSDEMILNLVYDKENLVVYGVRTNIKTGKRSLININPETGEISMIREVEANAVQFFNSGRSIITSSGEIIETKTGNIVSVINIS